MFKKLFTFLAMLVFSVSLLQADTIPSTSSNNTWTGTNNFVTGNLTLGATSHPCTQGSGYFMTGFDTDFSPICQQVSALSGVTSINSTTGAITLQGDGSTAVVTQSPSGTFTVSAPGSGVTTINGANGPISFANGTSISIVESPAGTFTINCSGCTGGSGSGTVTNASVARAFPLYAATGTTVSPHPQMYSLDSSMSLSAINALIASLNCGSSSCHSSNDTIVVPDGVPFQPWTNTVAGFPNSNPGTGIEDQRTGTKWVQMTRYGLVPDAKQVNFTLTSSSTSASTTANLSSADVGKTVSAGWIVGDYYTGTQYRFIATIASVQSSSSFTLSTAAPANATSIPGWYGTDNAPAFSNAMAGLINGNLIGDLSTNGFVGLLPAGYMLTTQTINWQGASWVGQNMSDSFIVGTPGQDVIQVSNGGGTGLYWGKMTLIPDGSISASQHPYTDVEADGTTSTVQPFSRPLHVGQPDSNNPLAQGWCASCNGNYVANITQNSSKICVPTALGRVPAISDEIVFPYTPSVFKSSVTANTGTTCGTNYTDVTISPAMPNTSGYTMNKTPFYASFAPAGIQHLASAINAGAMSYPVTITVANPTQPYPGSVNNVAAHGRIQIDSEQFEYMGVSYSSPYQLILRAGPATTVGHSSLAPVVPLNPCYASKSVPYPVTPSVNTVNITSWVSASGVVTFQASNVYAAGQIVKLENFGGSGGLWNGSVGAVLSSGLSSSQFQMASGSTVNTGTDNGNAAAATPQDAAYFPGVCGGNFALAQPDLDGETDTGSSFFRAHLEDVNMQPAILNPGKGLGGWYLAGNHAPYATTVDNFRVFGGDFGFAQGPASKNEWNIGTVGPTGDGLHLEDWSVTSAYIISMIGQQNSTIDRWDAYSTEYSPFDGSPIGGTGAIYLGYTLDETNGKSVQGTAFDFINNWNAEPENGSHIEAPPYLYSGCGVCVFNANSFEGSGAIIDGSNNRVSNEQLSASTGLPLIIYGDNNIIEDTVQTMTGPVSNTFGVGTVLNWGSNNTVSVPAAYGSGQNITVAGTRERTSGYDSSSFRDGLAATPPVSEKEGFFSNYEFSPAVLNGVDPHPTTSGPVIDTTAPESGSYVGCSIGSSFGCSPFHLGGFFGYYYIGQDQRIAAIPYIVTTAFKTTSNQTFNFTVNAVDAGTPNDTCSGFHQATNVNVTTVAGTWTTVSYPANFTGSSGCVLQFGWNNSTSTDVLQIAYMDLQPVPARTGLATVSSSIEGTTCSVPSMVGTDGNFVYFCDGAHIKRTPIT